MEGRRTYSYSESDTSSSEEENNLSDNTENRRKRNKRRVTLGSTAIAANGDEVETASVLSCSCYQLERLSDNNATIPNNNNVPLRSNLKQRYLIIPYNKNVKLYL